MDPRLLVIGLDCAAGELIFERTDWHLPTLRGLMARGSYGRLQTVMPAITIPAWACMVTGKDPGELGIYGFRNRSDHTYSGLALTTSLSVKEPAVWDHLSRAGKTVITVGVPPSFPPKPVNGVQVGCFLTPTAQSDYTFPSNRARKLRSCCMGVNILRIARTFGPKTRMTCCDRFTT